MSKNVVIFGGSFNPPGIHHRQIAAALAREFDEVIVVPCGPRPDKLTTNDVEPIFRATLACIGFAGLDRVHVDLFDLEQATFSRTHELEVRYADRGDIWHFVGGDIIEGGGAGQSFVHRVWHDGAKLWETLRFAVAARGIGGEAHHPHDMPPQSRLVELPISEGASSTIREKIFKREPFAHLVTPEVAAYIDRYGLYRGRVPSRVTKLDLSHPCWHVFADERNLKAMALAKQLHEYSGANTTDATPSAAPMHDDHTPANAVLAVGGDGTMLRAIREFWGRRVPFFGVNAGHLGFLLNNADDVFAIPNFGRDLISRQMPLLYIETQAAPDAPWKADFAFNDAWLERANSQSAWIEVTVAGQVRLPRLVCDGVLMSTASGSTAYARSMGATPLLADTPAWLLVGSNVMQPANWKSALLGTEQEVVLRSLDDTPGHLKRPLIAFVDGVPQGPVYAMRARMSRTAAVELAFLPDHDMADKIAQIQFPA